MSKIKVSLKFCKLNNASLSAYCKSVVNAMTDNVNYPTPDPDLKAVTQAITHLDNALAAQATGGKAATALKNEKIVALKDIMRLLAAYVQANGNNDLSILLSSGFEVTKTPGRRNAPSIPLNFELNGSLIGALKVQVKPVIDADGYQYHYTNDPTLQAGWLLSEAFTKSKSVLDGLTSNTRIYCQVRAFNAQGQSDWSPTVSRVVL